MVWFYSALGSNCGVAVSGKFGWWNHGSTFDDSSQLLQLHSHCDMIIEEIQIWVKTVVFAWPVHGEVISAIKFKLGNGVDRSYWFDKRGNEGSGPSVFKVPDGERITTVIVKYGGGIDSLRFITDRGTSSQKFGGDSGDEATLHLDGHLVGFYGRVNDVIENLGFISFN